MKACVVTSPFHYEMREVPIPEPQKGEVQIKMMAAGVCGSDIHIFKGENPNSRYPLIPGHENVGVVTKVGEGCSTIRAGDHVVIDYVMRCGTCYQCTHGRGNVCEHVLVRGSGTDGGWREYWCVEESYVYKIDDSIPWKDAALIEPLTIGEHSTSRARVCRDDVVLILGAGTIGTRMSLNQWVPTAGRMAAGKYHMEGLATTFVKFSEIENVFENIVHPDPAVKKTVILFDGAEA